MAERQQYRKLPAFEGVGTGQTATLRMPLGLTYHDILVSASWTTNDDDDDIFDEVRVLANGRILQRWAYADLKVMLKFDNITPIEVSAGTSCKFLVPFDRMMLMTRASIEVTSIGTGAILDAEGNPDPTPIQTLTMEIDIKANSTISGLSLVAHARQSAPEFAGLQKKVRQFTYPLVSGETEIADLPRGDLVNRVLFATGNVARLQLLIDNYISFDRTAADNDFIQDNSLYRDAQTGSYVYDPSELGYGSESLATAGVGDLRFIIESATAVPACRIAVEYIGVLET